MLTIKFTDGELIQNPTWNSMPNKPIQRLKYIFNGKTIIMEGYESYNHLKEIICAVLSNQTIVRCVYLMGRKGMISQVLKLNFIDNSIVEYQTEIDKEYGATPEELVWINGRPSTGWKQGQSALNPQYKIL
jgi:hypothetical protein